MGQLELTFVVALAFFLCFLIGWVLSRITTRISHVNGMDEKGMSDLTDTLLETEEERDNTIAYVQNREKELVNQLGQVKAELKCRNGWLGCSEKRGGRIKRQVKEIGIKFTNVLVLIHQLLCYQPNCHHSRYILSSKKVLYFLNSPLRILQLEMLRSYDLMRLSPSLLFH